jgi:predicted dithiol-disulfide oxidoreductase (DUF899 family)
MIEKPQIVSRDEWIAARTKLLAKEKRFTRERDALVAERRRMPWLAVEKQYEFDGPKGKASLLHLFEGRRQLIVYRAFFEPGVFGWPNHACRGCSLGADQVAHLSHLNARDTTLAYVSRAPQPDIERLKARMGWKMPWYTITDSFDTDFGVDEWHGTNAFIREGDKVFRTYFINNRGDEAMGTTWSYLDMTALGRQEKREDSRASYSQTRSYAWWSWHDGYRDANPSNPDSADPRPLRHIKSIERFDSFSRYFAATTHPTHQHHSWPGMTANTSRPGSDEFDVPEATPFARRIYDNRRPLPSVNEPPLTVD